MSPHRRPDYAELNPGAIGGYAFTRPVGQFEFMPVDVGHMQLFTHQLDELAEIDSFAEGLFRPN